MHIVAFFISRCFELLIFLATVLAQGRLLCHGVLLIALGSTNFLVFTHASGVFSLRGRQVTLFDVGIFPALIGVPGGAFTGQAILVSLDARFVFVNLCVSTILCLTYLPFSLHFPY